MKLFRYAALAATLVTAASAHAQSSTLVGRWEVEYQRGLRNENGEITRVMGKALLTLEQRGDSLVGQLEPLPDGGAPTGRSSPIAGRATGASATLIAKGSARVNMNGDERTIASTMTWELNASGDTLAGTMKREVEGMDMPVEPTPVRGTRIK